MSVLTPAYHSNNQVDVVAAAAAAATAKNYFDIVVRTLTGKQTPVTVTGRDTVLRLKEEIMCKEGIQLQSMEDESLLMDKGIQRGSIIVMFLRLRGCCNGDVCVL